MDDFMNKGEALSRAEFYAWREEQERKMKSLRDLTNGRFRCIGKRVLIQDKRVSFCVKMSITAFVLAIVAVVMAAMF